MEFLRNIETVGELDTNPPTLPDTSVRNLLSFDGEKEGRGVRRSRGLEVTLDSRLKTQTQGFRP